MKREDLKDWGLNDEQAEKVMAAYGKATQTNQAAQASLAAKDAEIAGLKEQLTQRDADIEKLKSGATDAQAIQQQLQELQTKYQADTTALNQKLADQKEEYETTRATEKFFSGVEFSSELAREAAIERFRRQGFKRDGDSFTGGTEWLEKLRKDSPESFKAKEDPKGNPNPPENKPRFTRFLGGGDPKDGKPELPRVF
ncbi:MAG: phage scaffolding protein [Clostridia bacterium]|nr:phage scaffolding protein [Clostridia bacterium]